VRIARNQAPYNKDANLTSVSLAESLLRLPKTQFPDEFSWTAAQKRAAISASDNRSSSFYLVGAGAEVVEPKLQFG